jgi:hypothetical protein
VVQRNFAADHRPRDGASTKNVFVNLINELRQLIVSGTTHMHRTYIGDCGLDIETQYSFFRLRAFDEVDIRLTIRLFSAQLFDVPATTHVLSVQYVE